MLKKQYLLSIKIIIKNEYPYCHLLINPGVFTLNNRTFYVYRGEGAKKTKFECR